MTEKEIEIEKWTFKILVFEALSNFSARHIVYMMSAKITKATKKTGILESTLRCRKYVRVE